MGLPLPPICIAHTLPFPPQTVFQLPFNLSGLSSWGRRVGRRLRTADSEDRLEYAVNPASADGGGGTRLGSNNGDEEFYQQQSDTPLPHELPTEILRSSVPDLRRKVSRVESLRRLILGASHLDSRRLFDKKKYRIRRASMAAGGGGKVDKSIGTDLDLLGGGGFSEEDLFDRTSSRFNVSCESFDLDSVSQLSLAEAPLSSENQRSVGGGGGGGGNSIKSISSDNIPHEVMTAYQRTAVSHAFIRSRLASLPEEHPAANTLRRQAQEERRPRSGSLVVAVRTDDDDDDEVEEGDEQQMLSLTGPQSLRSDILRPGIPRSGSNNAADLSRKRSQSMADIIQRVALAAAEPPGEQHHHHHHHQHLLHQKSLEEPAVTGVINRHKIFTKTRSEESGYDSDTTRKSGSSPRGSVKSDSFDPSETDSNCDSHLKSDLVGRPINSPLLLPSGHYEAVAIAVSPESSAADPLPEVATKPRIKKPPRKSKEEPRRAEISCQTDNISSDQVRRDEIPGPPLATAAVVTPAAAAEEQEEESGLGRRPGSSTLPLNFTDNMPTTLPSLTSKSFKMVRLFKGEVDELGIIISKKRNPSKGTTGYIIAHIEPDGLVNK
jgi:hypothetical protein